MQTRKLVPIALFAAGAQTRRLIPITLFAAAMAYLEAAVVV